MEVEKVLYVFAQHCYGHCYAIHLQREWEEKRNLWNLSWTLKTINSWDLNLYQHNFVNEDKQEIMYVKKRKLETWKKGLVLIEKGCSIWKEVFDYSFYSQIFQRCKQTANLWQEVVISYFHGVHLLKLLFSCDAKDVRSNIDIQQPKSWDRTNS